MNEARATAQMLIFVLRGCWIWLAMWCWLLWSTFQSLGPSLSLQQGESVQFEAFLGICGWLTSGAIVLAGSSSPRAFWRGRPWSSGTVVGCKLALLILAMGMLPLWLESRLLSQAPWPTPWQFWFDGMITFVGGALVPGALAAFFPSWAGFLTASIGFGLAVQAVRYVLFAFNLGGHHAMTSIAGVLISGLAAVGLWLAFSRPSSRRLPWIVAVLWAMSVPVGAMWSQMEPSKVLSPPGGQGSGVEIQRPQAVRSLLGADFYQFYARVALEDSLQLDEQVSGSVRWLGSRWVVDGGPTWRTRSRSQMELLTYGSGRDQSSQPDLISAVFSKQGPVLVISADEVAPFVDRAGRLELDVVVSERQPELVGRLRLLEGATVALDDGVLRVHEARRQGSRFVLRLGFSELITGQSFVAEPPVIPSLHLPGWNLEPSAAEDPLEAWHRGQHFKVLLRQVASFFPSHFRLQYFIFQDRFFVAETQAQETQVQEIQVQETTLPDYLELWQVSETESDRRTLVLSGVTLAELDGSSESLQRFHERELKAFKGAEQ